MLLTKDQIRLFKKALRDKKLSMCMFDLETSPSEFYGFSLDQQHISHSQIKDGTDTRIITAQYKSSLIDKKSKYLVWDWDGKRGGNDRSLVKEFISILNSYDIVIGQNVREFDLKVLQNRAKQLKLPPVEVDLVLDTLTSSRASFRQLSHKLDYRSKQYGLGGKHRMEMQDWIDIVEGRVSPLKKMVPYGLKDNDDGEYIFWRDLPYVNLPKATVNKILRLSGQSKSLYCQICRKNHRLSTDIRNFKGRFKCNNCKQVFDKSSLK